MKYALTLALVLALSLVANAAITAPQTNGGITVTITQDTTTPPTIAGLTAYIITLSSANNIAAVDGRIDAVGAGHLYQTFAYGGAAATPNGEGLTTTTLKNDTHILVSAGNQTPARAPDENLNGFDYTGAVVDASLHNGTTLCGVGGNTDGAGTNTPVPNDWSQTMAFGIKNGGTSLAFARVVLDTASNSLGAMFKFKVVDSTSAFGQFNFNILTVPEPMTLSLLGAGVMALIRRRR